MTPIYIRADDGRTFTLSTGSDEPPKTYSNDKDGKRQAILDGLRAIDCIIANEARYLPHDAAMQVVAAIMQPDGIPTKEAYQIVCDVTARACAYLGYGDEIALAPPQVSFAQRGSYRKQYPSVTEASVRAVLATASISREQPQKEMMAETMWNQLAWELYNCSLAAIGEAERTLIQEQTDSIIELIQWQKRMRGRTAYYIQFLVPEMEDVQGAVTAEIGEAEGMPISYLLLTRRVNIAAYGRHFYKAELAPAVMAATIHCPSPCPPTQTSSYNNYYKQYPYTRRKRGMLSCLPNYYSRCKHGSPSLLFQNGRLKSW